MEDEQWYVENSKDPTEFRIYRTGSCKGVCKMTHPDPLQRRIDAESIVALKKRVKELERRNRYLEGRRSTFHMQGMDEQRARVQPLVEAVEALPLEETDFSSDWFGQPARMMTYGHFKRLRDALAYLKQEDKT